MEKKTDNVKEMLEIFVKVAGASATVYGGGNLGYAFKEQKTIGNSNTLGTESLCLI